MKPAHTVAFTCCLALSALARPCIAQATAAAEPGGKKQVSLTFDRKGVPVGHYRLAVNEDGVATYEGDEISVATGHGLAADQTARPFQHQTRITATTSSRIFSLAERLKHFDVPCASKAKNIADMGNKTLLYQGPDGTGTCSFNYSDDKDVRAITEIFQGIAETLDQGRLLDRLHRFDRLSLDDAVGRLASEVSAGSALEIGTIAPSLKAIAADTGVMSRARSRAADLLNQSGYGSSTP